MPATEPTAAKRPAAFGPVAAGGPPAAAGQAEGAPPPVGASLSAGGVGTEVLVAEALLAKLRPAAGMEAAPSLVVAAKHAAVTAAAQWAIANGSAEAVYDWLQPQPQPQRE